MQSMSDGNVAAGNAACAAGMNTTVMSPDGMPRRKINPPFVDNVCPN
jgi:hypothetical protein